MADRAAWVAQAFLRYHAGQITWDELQALVLKHREANEQLPETTVLDRDTR